MAQPRIIWGGIEYSGTALEAIYHAEGRLTPNGSNFYYEYTLKDHLGNARINFRANGTAVTFLEEHHYYPFGMKMEGIGTGVAGNKYTYNYKEMNDDFGLNLYDYGARWYDAALGRWWSKDPLADKMPSWSPYNYVASNPLNLIDPNGKEWVNPYWDALKKELNKEGEKDLKKLDRLAKLGQNVQNVLHDLEKNDPELYNYIECLTLNDGGLESPVRVSVYLSKEGIDNSEGGSGGNGAEGVTHYKLVELGNKTYKGKKMYDPMPGIGDETGREIDYGGVDNIVKTRGIGFNIFLYKKDARTLANEAGDVMFAIEYNQDAYAEYRNQQNPGKRRDYYSTGAGRYSFAVEAAFTMRSKGSFGNANIYPLVWHNGAFSTQDGTIIKK